METTIKVSITELISSYLRDNFKDSEVVIAVYNYSNIGSLSFNPASPGPTGSISLFLFDTYEEYMNKRDYIDNNVTQGQDRIVFMKDHGFLANNIWRYPLE